MAVSAIGGVPFAEPVAIPGYGDLRGLVGSADLELNGFPEVLGFNDGLNNRSEIQQWPNGPPLEPTLPFSRIVLRMSGASLPRPTMGDVNRDGIVDFLHAGYERIQIVVGWPTWTNRWFFAWSDVSGRSLVDIPTYEIAVTWGRVPSGQLVEVDGDGLPDVLLSTGDGTDVRWLRNLGGGRQWKEYDLADSFAGEGTSSLSLRGIDLDGDGDGDLLGIRTFESGAQELLWLENVDATGEAWTLRFIDAEPGAHLRSFKTADLDGDGELDVVATTGGKESVIWWENRLRAGASWRRQALPLGAPLVDTLLPRDLDADGDVDLVLRVHGGKSLAWFENLRGTPPAFELHQSPLSDTGTTDWIFDDFDRDGDLDFVFRPTYVGADAGPSAIYLVENQSPHRSARFGAGIDIRADVAGATSPIAADFNNDGTVDIAGLATTDNVLKVWLNVVGDGRSWWEQEADTLTGGKQRVVAGDPDLDGDTDLIVMGGPFHGAWWLENDGAPLPGWQRRRIGGSAAGPVVVADMNRDGVPDVVTGSIERTVVLFDSEGDPTADGWSERILAEDLRLAVLAHGDFDNDGFTDLVGGSTQGDELVWMRNRDSDPGDEEVPFEVSTVPGSRNFSVSALAVADVDGDGDLDLVAANAFQSTIHWWENLGGEPLQWWRREIDEPTLGGAREIRAADMDGDGDVDLVGAGLGTALLPQSVVWWENLDGEGDAWFRHADWSGMTSPTGVFVADINRDARPDIVAASHLEERITWWENEGGAFRLEARDLPTVRIASGRTVAVIGIRLTHVGQAGDSGIVPESLRFAFADDQGAPLPAATLATYFPEISLYRDEGSGSFEPDRDTRLVTVAGSSGNDGVYDLALEAAAAGPAVDPGQSADFFLTVTVPAESRVEPIDDFHVAYLAEGSRVVDRDGGVELDGLLTADFTSSVKRLGEIIHVDARNSGPADGSSWVTAFPSLQDALDAALAEDEIWVARGTYFPVDRHGGDTERHRSFQLVNRVAVFGGFSGTETARDARDWRAHPTVLSGNLGAPDSDADNCLHVFHHPVGAGLDASAELDGFTITGGNADEAPLHDAGGGMFNDECSPTLRNCTFVGNAASQSGGAVCNRNDASPAIVRCRFLANAADGGGAIANWNRSSPSIEDCLFERNRAIDDGGALFSYIDCAPTVTGSIFRANAATADTSDGGAVYNGMRTTLTLSNCLFFGNLAHHGGAILNLFDSRTEATHVTIGGNAAALGGAVHNIDSTTALTNGILWDNGPGDAVFDDEDSATEARHCDIDGKLWPGEGNVTVTPGFAHVPRFWDRATGTGSTTHLNVADGGAYAAGDAIELDDDGFARTVTDVTGGKVTFAPPFREATGRGLLVANWGPSLTVASVDESFALTEGSPCLDAGTNALVPPLHADLAGNPRPHDGDNDGTATNDMGAYEFAGNVVFVDADATGGDASGLSWPNAFTDLQEALDAATPGFEIWVAEGTYAPSRRSDPGDPRSAAFRLRNGVAILGGFDPSAGVTALPQRDPEAHATILSGNIGDPDDATDDSYHVLHHPAELALDETAVLDGFVVAHGSADRDAPHDRGGGMFNDRCSPTVINCAFETNAARMGGAIFNIDASPRFTACRIGAWHPLTSGNEAVHGGGMFNLRAAPILTDCRFENNRSGGEGNGGALYNDRSSPELLRVAFEGNDARGTATLFGQGGAIFCRESSPNLTECTFTGNAAHNDGGGIAWEGATTSEISRCEFEGNTADRGGALYCDGNSPRLTDLALIGNIARDGDGGGMACVAGAAPVVTRCFFVGNRAGARGGGLFCDASSPVIADSLFNDGEADSGGGIHCRFGSSPSLTDCDIFGNTALTNGGGIHLYALSNPTLEHCAIAGNTVSSASHGFGGGVACQGSSPVVRLTGITENSAHIAGGGLWFYELAIDETTHPAGGSFSACVIGDNEAERDGGGVFCGAGSSPSFLDSAIRDNTVTGASAGGFGIGGGIACFDGAAPVFANSAIHGNEAARDGGGIGCFGADPEVTNCVVHGNLAGEEGGGFHGDSSAAVFTNTVFWENSPDEIGPPGGGGASVTHCLVPGGFGAPADGNLDGDPMFRDAAGGDYHLTGDSPCIDAGSNAAPHLPATDFEGGARILDGNADGTAIVDIGVDEFDLADLLSYAAWKEAVIGDPDADDFADPDFDGIPHVMEFALGGDPFRADADRILPDAAKAAGGLYITFRERPTPDIVYLIEAAGEFGSWEVIYDSNSPESATGDVLKDGETTSVGIPIEIGSGAFLRLRVKRTE